MNEFFVYTWVLLLKEIFKKLPSHLSCLPVFPLQYRYWQATTLCPSGVLLGVFSPLSYSPSQRVHLASMPCPPNPTISHLNTSRNRTLFIFLFCIFIFLCFNVLKFFITYFLHLHFKCYPEIPLYPSSALFPYPPTPTSWPWHSPVLGHMIFARPKASPSIDGRLGHPLPHMQLDTQFWGVLVS